MGRVRPVTLATRRIPVLDLRTGMFHFLETFHYNL
jgi:hypothetical protein